MDLKGRNFLTLKDFTPEEITYLLDLAADLKEKKKNGVPVDHYHGKNIALIFEKTSTRTRCAFEVAAHDMGMGTTYLDPSGSQIGKYQRYSKGTRKNVRWHRVQRVRAEYFGRAGKICGCSGMERSDK